MTDTLTALLLRRIEQGPSALLWGREARPHYGRAFDRLVAAGILVEEPPMEVWSTCTHCHCGYNWRPIQRIGGRIVAACPIDAEADTELDEDDLRSFVIDAAALIALLASESELDGAVEEIAPHLWLLGRLHSGRTILLALAKDAIAHPGATLLIRAIAPGAPATLLAPAPTAGERRRFKEGGFDLVETLSALRTGPCGIDRLDELALTPKAAGPRLSIQATVRAVLVDGTPQHVPPQPFKLLALLARAVRDGEGPVSNRAIEDATGRDARDLARELRDALSAGRTNASELRNWIEAQRGLGAFQLALEPGDVEIATRA